jgi:hypothetical protein
MCERTIDGPGGPLRLRIYKPLGTGPFPLLVFFHGSGFVLCSLDTHDGMCRNLCAGTACVVVSVDYRLAPEHKFPAGIRGLPARCPLGGGPSLRTRRRPNASPSRAIAPTATWPRLPQDRLVDVPEHGRSAEGVYRP